MGKQSEVIDVQVKVGVQIKLQEEKEVKVPNALLKTVFVACREPSSLRPVYMVGGARRGQASRARGNQHQEANQ